MKVQLITYTPDPERVVATAAHLCYSKKSINEILDDMNSDKAEKLIKKIVDMGHISPLEHISFTFGIEGISRSCLAQLTRHRIASYSVQSQRYLSMEEFEAIIPTELQFTENEEIFQNTIETITSAYKEIHRNIKETYQSRGLSERDSNSIANETARSLLPNATPTNLIMTMNARSLLNFLSLRMCERAQDEIRFLAYQMLILVYPIAPNIFKKAGPPCIRGNCPEGALSCGKPEKIRTDVETYKNLTLV